MSQSIVYRKSHSLDHREIDELRGAVKPGGRFYGKTYSYLSAIYRVPPVEIKAALTGTGKYKKVACRVTPVILLSDTYAWTGKTPFDDMDLSKEGDKTMAKTPKYLSREEAQYVLWLRHRRGQSAQSIADEMGVNFTTIYDILNGTGKWSYLTGTPIPDHDPRQTTSPAPAEQGNMAPALVAAGIVPESAGSTPELDVTPARWVWGRDSRDTHFCHLWRADVPNNRVKSACGIFVRNDEKGRLRRDKDAPYCFSCEQFFIRITASTAPSQSAPAPAIAPQVTPAQAQAMVPPVVAMPTQTPTPTPDPDPRRISRFKVPDGRRVWTADEVDAWLLGRLRRETEPLNSKTIYAEGIAVDIDPAYLRKSKLRLGVMHELRGSTTPKPGEDSRQSYWYLPSFLRNQSATDKRTAPPRRDRRWTQREVGEWLNEMLAHGPISMKVIMKRAEDLGLAPPNVRKGKLVADIQHRYVGKKGTFWFRKDTPKAVSRPASTTPANAPAEVTPTNPASEPANEAQEPTNVAEVAVPEPVPAPVEPTQAPPQAPVVETNPHVKSMLDIIIDMTGGDLVAYGYYTKAQLTRHITEAVVAALAANTAPAIDLSDVLAAQALLAEAIERLRS